MTNKSFNINRKFGVEIEFFFDASRRGGLSAVVRKQNIIAELAAKGIELVQEGYNHHTRNHWKLVTDSSVSFEGLEIVSPPLKGREGLKQLEVVLEVLNKYEARVDKSCGIHVHHDINDFEIKDIKNLYASYIKFEKVFDQFVPRSRRAQNNRFCGSLQTFEYTVAPETVNRVLGKVKQADSITDLDYVHSSRYKKLNLKSYLKYGTIEFRQHAGSTDFEKIKNWILLTQHFVNNSLVRKVDFKYSEKWDTMAYFTDVTNMTPAKGTDEELCNVLKYFKKRAKELAVS